MKLEVEAEVKEYKGGDYHAFYIQLSVGGYMFFDSPMMSEEAAKNSLELLKKRGTKKNV